MHFVWTHGTRTQDVNEKAGQRESHWIYTLLVKKNHHCFCPKHRQTVDDFNSPLAGNIEIASKVRRQLVCIIHVACLIAPFLITLSELRGHSLIIMLLNAISRRSHSAVDKSSTDSVAQSVCDSRACFRPHRMRSEYVLPICYRRSGVIGVGHMYEPCRMAELIEMPFGSRLVWIQGTCAVDGDALHTGNENVPKFVINDTKFFS